MIDLLVELDYKTVSGYRRISVWICQFYRDQLKCRFRYRRINGCVCGLLINPIIMIEKVYFGDILIRQFLDKRLRRSYYTDLIYKITPTF